jgi:hypothetical protein
MTLTVSAAPKSLDTARIRSNAKGKEQHRERYRLLEDSGADASREIRVRSKECELTAVMEGQRSNERRWERDREGEGRAEKQRLERDKEKSRDKEMIKMLEQEILKLKEEVHNFAYRFLLV